MIDEEEQLLILITHLTLLPTTQGHSQHSQCYHFHRRSPVCPLPVLSLVLPILITSRLLSRSLPLPAALRRLALFTVIP